MRSCFLLFVSAAVFACGTIPERTQELEFQELASKVKENPGDANLRLDLGEKLAYRGYSQAAIRVWSEGLQLNPNERRFLWKIADCQYSIGEERNAISSYRELLAEGESDPSIYYRLAWCYLHVHDNEKALATWQDYRRVRPKDAMGPTGIGIVRLRLSEDSEKKDQLDLAMEEFRTAIVLDPHCTEAHFHLGIALERKGELDRAIGEYQKALFEKPEATAILENLALVYLKQQRNELARPLLRKALDLEKDSRRKKEIEDRLRSL